MNSLESKELHQILIDGQKTDPFFTIRFFRHEILNYSGVSLPDDTKQSVNGLYGACLATYIQGLHTLLFSQDRVAFLQKLRTDPDLHTFTDQIDKMIAAVTKK